MNPIIALFDHNDDDKITNEKMLIFISNMKISSSCRRKLVVVVWNEGQEGSRAG
jgi:hypothetical protein